MTLKSLPAPSNKTRPTQQHNNAQKTKSGVMFILMLRVGSPNPTNSLGNTLTHTFLTNTFGNTFTHTFFTNTLANTFSTTPIGNTFRRWRGNCLIGVFQSARALFQFTGMVLARAAQKHEAS